MKIVKSILGISSVLLLCGALFQWRLAAGLRAEAERVRSDNNEPLEMTAPAPGSNSATEQKERLRESGKGLLKLRNEARQLREQLKELVSIRATNERLVQALASGAPSPAQVPVPEGFIGKEALTDQGLATPEAAAQTFFWAMREGNVTRLYESTTPGFAKLGNLERMTPEQRQELYADFADELRKQMQNFRDFRIVERNVPAPETAMLKVQSSVGGPSVEMVLRRLDGQWKVEKPF